MAKWLIEQKVTDKAALDAIESELEAEMQKAVEFAVAAPYPSPDEVTEDVYA
jgi:TPP-dependent pyruvate/acetoin dehydrogenase alpha subunit